MKTLREYIDILDEISRRDFLKGAGAAAAGAAMGVGGKVAYDNVAKGKNIPSTEQVYYLLGMANRISVVADLNPELDRYNKLTQKAQSEARINLESLPPGQAKVLRSAYNRGWDAGQEIIDHIQSGQGYPLRTSVLADEVSRYAKNYMEKLIQLLNN